MKPIRLADAIRLYCPTTVTATEAGRHPKCIYVWAVDNVVPSEVQ